MRVLQIIHSRNFAGSEQSVLTLSEALRNEGVTVFVGCRGGGRLRSIIAAAGIPLADPPLAWWRGSGGLRGFIRRERIDLVHTHLTQAARIGLELRRKEDIALVSHLRIQRRDPVFGAILDAGGHLIANSEPTARYYLDPEGGSLPPGPAFHTIPNATGIADHPDAGIDPQTARETLFREWNLSPQARYVLLTGRVSPGKGHDLMVEAWGRLCERYPRHHLVFAGNVEQKPEFVRALRKSVQRLGLESRVHFLGFRNDVPRIIRGADVQVVPSRNEAFGLVVIEAMALGTPVLGSNSGAIPGILGQGRYGSLFAPGDPDSLARELEKLLDDPETARQTAAAARIHCLNTYGPTVLARRVLEVYRQVIRK